MSPLLKWEKYLYIFETSFAFNQTFNRMKCAVLIKLINKFNKSKIYISAA